MNIKEAKEQIRNAMRAYFSRDELGNYEIPIERQRPVFLMGPPGIGKTAVMEQIAQEMNVALLSYSMTHHTRQSALGLPFISHREFEGMEYDLSEYTMSEIIASIYEIMKETGRREGILFLDEINCVSETLAPVMLQFLQYKIFGKHRVPDGWIVVTAGNPPEYNNSVREFDIVTWDRLKRIDVEPDFDCWKEYAYHTGMHAAIMTYLEIKKQNFYKVETSVGGKTFVTARGWDDLSQMIRLYEKNGIDVDEKLIGQYLQNRQIAKDFATYYQLFRKYRSDYQIDTILAGNASEEIRQRAKDARFDERLSILGLILDAVFAELREVLACERLVYAYRDVLKACREEMEQSGGDEARSGADEAQACIRMRISGLQKELEQGRRAGSLSMREQKKIQRLMERLEAVIPQLHEAEDGKAVFARYKADFDALRTELKAGVVAADAHLDAVFGFCEDVFGDGQEMLVLVTELTVSTDGAAFISRYGCKKYFEHNKDLLFYERQQEILGALE